MKTLLKFKCNACHHVFDAEGTKEEWVSPTYGPCYEYKAPCPSCGASVKEHRPRVKHPSIAESSSEGCGEGACASGEGPCDSGPCASDSGDWDD